MLGLAGVLASLWSSPEGAACQQVSGPPWGVVIGDP